MSGKLLLCLFPFLVASAQTGNVYVQHNLVSDVPGLADVTDPNLVDPWGLSFSTTSPFWVSNHGAGNTTVYNNASSAGITVTSTLVTIPSGFGGPTPSAPTGQVQNNTSGFLLPNGTKASFIFCTEDGTVSAWNGGKTATVMIDNSAAGTVYKGMAIGSTSAGPLLYLANFSYGTIDVLDTNFKLTTVPGGFGDANLPAGYAPFNIWPLNGSLYVMFAKQDARKKNDAPGPGNGVVDVFDFNGNFLQRLAAGGPLNSPWGVAMAPAGWGAFSNSVLIGNFGDGKINSFDPATGKFLGALQDSTGAPISIQGLWAILFGNGASGGDNHYLYFTAGILSGGAQHGLLGSIAPPAQVMAVQNAASGVSGPIAPGEVVTLTGISIGPRPAVSSPSLSSNVNDGTSLGGTSVTFDGIPAPILYTQADQTNVIVPWSLTGSTAMIAVTTGTTALPPFQVSLAATAPGLFNSGGAVLAFNQDGTLNSASNAAAAGTVVVLYATGLGQTNPLPQDGVRSSFLVLAEVAASVTVSIGGKTAQLIYAGSAPGQIAGVMQVEAVVPLGAGVGTVPVVVAAGQASSQPNVTINLK
ncbi:MAG TPA: TIGR03118 family protein [Bryobacteraceae bacterium]|nr:TIGR03118 family protein [Bryobacteraceae bacterium]